MATPGETFARPPIGRPFPIVPQDRRAGRSLVAVIAVLAFLAALAAGAATLVATGSAEWRAALAGEATIQVRPVPGRDGEADVQRAATIARAHPGIRAAEPVSRPDSERLLEPWLGSGLDLSDLPVPRLVVLRFDPVARPDLGTLAIRLRAEIPGVSLDDHAAWIGRLSTTAATAVALALALVLLVLAASGGAIAFATRAAVASHRDVVEVLHLVGAGEDFIARAFARRFARLATLGGLIGSVAAGGLIALAGGLTGAAGPGSGEMAAVVGGVATNPWPYLAAALVALADGAIAALVTLGAVRRFLRSTS